VAESPYRAPVPIAPPRRRLPWLRVVITLAVGLLCGLPIAAAVPLAVLFIVAGVVPLAGDGRAGVLPACICLSFFFTPLVVGGLAYGAMERPKNEAFRFLLGTSILAMTALMVVGAAWVMLSTTRW
jgi:hypothetical protein